MSDTWAVALDKLAKVNFSQGTGQPLCPRCKGGRLHPYYVSIALGFGVNDSEHGADYPSWLGGDLCRQQGVQPGHG